MMTLYKVELLPVLKYESIYVVCEDIQECINRIKKDYKDDISSVSQVASEDQLIIK